jgi:hypothetical protein
MNSLVCPNCGAELIEDAWESVVEKENGRIVVDAYPAFVCREQCGYVKRIEIGPKIIAQQGKERLLILYPNNQGRILDVHNYVIWPPMYYESILGRGYWEEYTGNHDLEMLLKEARDSESAFRELPNLFKFATSELSQDAFLCWLFEHVRLKTNEVVYKIAKQILNLIFDKHKVHYPDSEIRGIFDYTLKIEQQVHKIDVLLTFESENKSEKIYIIIEDKTNSGESRENQPEYYAEILKVKDLKAAIIPVLFKTGYTTKEEQKKFEERKVVFIGYEDIYHLFVKFTQEIKQNVILNSWWINFCNKYYKPIKLANSFIINPNIKLVDLNKMVRDISLPDSIVFQKVIDFLFNQIAGEFSTKTYSVQGKGHIDWHFELSKQNWSSAEKNIAVSLYFIWDIYDFSLVIKTSPFKYKPLKKLTRSEKREYIETRDTIKEELKMVKQINWKMTNYYLQIAQMNDIHKIPLDSLKKKIKNEIIQISNEIDRIME